jgi:hypothetical protein
MACAVKELLVARNVVQVDVGNDQLFAELIFGLGELFAGRPIDGTKAAPFVTRRGRRGEDIGDLHDFGACFAHDGGARHGKGATFNGEHSSDHIAGDIGRGRPGAGSIVRWGDWRLLSFGGCS